MKVPDNFPEFDSRPGKGTVKGTPVWAEAIAEVRWQIISQFAKIAWRWGYAPVETPLIEERSLFAHAVGEQTDIVHKEMFAVVDPKGRHAWVLRPEGTAPVMRARVAEGAQWQRQRLWYCGPMFRYERPQNGRLRQFTQFGVESYATGNVAEDLQTLLLGQELLSLLPAGSFILELGALGCRVCRPAFRAALVAFLGERTDALCADCRERVIHNPLRTFDCKVPECQEILLQAPSMQDYLCTSCQDRQGLTKAGLMAAGVSYRLNRRLVRGLDYYNGLVFEWTTEKLGAQSAIAAGGRYDGMSTLFGHVELPAIGFAIGLERILALLQEVRKPVSAMRMPGAYWVFLEPENQEWLAALRLVRERLPVEADFSGRSIKACLRSANHSGYRFALLTGEDERLQKQVTVKDLAKGTQERVPVDRLAAVLAHRLTEEGEA